MNYAEQYNQLIAMAQARKLPRGTKKHRHHIVPRCMGGGDERENLVDLTIDEHDRAHQWLACIYPDVWGLTVAAMMLGDLTSLTPDERTEISRKNAERMRARNADPEFAKANAERGRKQMQARNADPEFAKANAERMRAMNADPEFAKANAERGGKYLRAMHADPEFAKVRDERWRALNADPEFAKVRDERLRVLHADPEFRRAASERMRALHASRTPEQRAEAARHASSVRHAKRNLTTPSTT